MIEACNVVFVACTEEVGGTVTVRHTIHDSYQGYQDDDLDQQHYTIRAVRAGGDVYERTIHATGRSVLGLSKRTWLTLVCTASRSLPLFTMDRVYIFG